MNDLYFYGIAKDEESAIKELASAKSDFDLWFTSVEKAIIINSKQVK
jgi:hypothetical protein